MTDSARGTVLFRLISARSIVLIFWVQKNAKRRMNCIRLKSLVNAASNEPRVGIQGASPTKWQVILSDEINIAIFRDNFFPSVFFINTPHFRMFSLRRRAACQISWISLKISLNPGSNEPEVSLNGLREGYFSYLYIFTIL